jgi:hypothetical protein
MEIIKPIYVAAWLAQKQILHLAEKYVETTFPSFHNNNLNPFSPFSNNLFKVL